MENEEVDIQSNNQFHIKEFYILQGRVDAIKELMQFQFNSLKELITANFKAVEESTAKALASSDKKLDVMNEFRNSLNDYVAHLMPRKEFEGKHEEIREENIKAHDGIKEELSKINIWRAEIQTELKEKVSSEDIKRIQGNHRLTLAIAIIGILTAILIAWFKHG
jgi:CHASE3 domain sensor protein